MSSAASATTESESSQAAIIEKLTMQLEAALAMCDQAEAAKERAEHENDLLRRQVESFQKKCQQADEDRETSRKIIMQLQEEAVRLERVVASFRNGSKFERLRNMYEGDLRKLRHRIKMLNSDLAAAERALKTMRKNWGDVFDDFQRQIERERAEHQRELKLRDKKEEAAADREKRHREQHRKICEKLKQKETECEELKANRDRLERLVNMNHENSSMTSNACEVKRGKIANSREPSGRPPGAQPGHKGHGRKRLKPDLEIVLKAPPEIADSEDWIKTGEEKVHQVIGLRVQIEAVDLISEEYKNVHTGKKYWPPFPAEAVNDVNYAESTKAALLYLTHNCNVSIDKARQFMHDLSGGVLNVSHGFVESLPRQFSDRTVEEREKIFNDLKGARFAHADFTVGWVNGKRAAVGVCSDGKSNVLYMMSRKKGHEAAKLLPIQDILTLVSDRESTLLNNYGVHHQVCLEHLRRDLKDVLQNDPKREWAAQMMDLLCTLRKKAKTWGGRGLPKEERRRYEREYDEILKHGEKEYESKPASDGLPQGPILLNALRVLKKHVLYFVRHPWIPPDNSEAERRVRLFKRKQHQCVTFRSYDGLASACDFLSVTTSARLQGKDVFEEILSIFRKPKPASQPKEAEEA